MPEVNRKPFSRSRQAGYAKVLREDNRSVLRAASAASKEAEFLLAFLPQAIAADDEGMGRLT